MFAWVAEGSVYFGKFINIDDWMLRFCRLEWSPCLPFDRDWNSRNKYWPNFTNNIISAERLMEKPNL